MTRSHVVWNDHIALAMAASQGWALCTIVAIEGSFSRRLGAQLAVSDQGEVVGSLADGCLERQLVTEADLARQDQSPRLVRFGKGSQSIDFQLPCGSSIDVLVDPEPNRVELREALASLSRRDLASITLPIVGEAEFPKRHYRPAPRLLLLGTGPEVDAALDLAANLAITVDVQRPAGEGGSTQGLFLGKIPSGLWADRWTAIALLFHDHEWERALLAWALTTDAFFVGAQGGAQIRSRRREDLLAAGLDEIAIARVSSPVGLIPHARDPQTLALSLLAEVIAKYDAGAAG
ncbi:XdhC family protein [Altererythrobacter sp. GH1-8]|uniref:XdhC family protein n=1 Tax=Altererythrobacter sp. GH1-8 TaxID=3349333 RepID=UPI00374D9C8D